MRMLVGVVLRMPLLLGSSDFKEVASCHFEPTAVEVVVGSGVWVLGDVGRWRCKIFIFIIPDNTYR